MFVMMAAESISEERKRPDLSVKAVRCLKPSRPSRRVFCFVLFSLQLSVCLWWHDYRRDDFPTLKFGVVMADLLAIRRERSPLH